MNDPVGANGRSPLPGRLQNVAREMAWQMWPALAPEDRLLIPAPPPSEYIEYLEGLGFELPSFGVKADRERLFTPFGWNAEAERLNEQYRNPSSHPIPEITTRVNSREFSQRLEAELFPEHIVNPPLKGRDRGRCPELVEGWGAIFCADRDELEKGLRALSPGRWVAKGNHGHAGIGQLRFTLPDGAVEVRAHLLRILEAQGGLLLEPEQDIAVEFGCLFLLQQDGALQGLRCHRLLSYSGGGFAGALYLPEDSEFRKWQDDIEGAMIRIGERLHLEGYFGPVGIDVYVWRDGDRLRFRPLVDLNARCSMAFPVHGLSRRFPDCAVLVSQVPSTIQLPKNPDELRTRLGNLHFDQQTRQGAFLITPLMPGPRRHAWAFIGNGEADVLEMRERVLRVGW